MKLHPEFERYRAFSVETGKHLCRLVGLPDYLGVDDADTLINDLILHGMEDLDPKRTPDERAEFIRKRIRSLLKNMRHAHLAEKRVRDYNGLSVDEAPHGTFDEDGNEEDIESGLISDEGRQAEIIRLLGVEPDEPEHITMTRQVANRIMNDSEPENRDKRRVMRHLWGLCQASIDPEDLLTFGQKRKIVLKRTKKKSGLREGDFWGILKKFRIDFDQCLQAYLAHLHKKWLTANRKKVG